MSDRCAGGCCRDFVLPYSYDEMQDRGRLYRETHAARLAQETTPLHDWLQVPDLLIPLPGPTAYHHRDHTREPGSFYHHYTCKAFDAATGNCTIYETRPHMCRDYPYKQLCKYDDCGWRGHRATSPKLRVITE